MKAQLATVGHADQTLRICARCHLLKPHHARGLCSNCYVNHRDEFPSTRHVRPYSAKEREFIRRNWNQKSAREIAEALGRNVQDVYSAAARFGASMPKHTLKTDEKLRRRLVRLHGKGLSDREIGKIVGFGHGTVARWLRRLGLPSNCRTRPTDPFPERTRAKQRQAAMERIREQGLEVAVPFLAKHLDGRIRAMEMGWPQAETLFEARILESLFEHGASTNGQLAADLGVRGNWLGQVVRDMKRRGLVAVMYREGADCAYSLAFGLKKRWEKDVDPLRDL